jgi:hypothetical protein
MFSVLHSDMNSLKSGLLHLTGRPYCKKRSAKFKDGVRKLILRNYLNNHYSKISLHEISMGTPRET